MIKLHKEAIKFLIHQRSQFKIDDDFEYIENMYNKLCENYCDMLFKSIPKDIKTICDVGGGIGGISVVLAQRGYKVVILEKNGFDEDKRKGGFNTKESFAAYNTEEVTKKIWIASGLKETDFNYINVDKPFDFPVCDLVFSSLSWGFHYPLGTYWESANKSKFVVADCRGIEPIPDNHKVLQDRPTYKTCLWTNDV